MLDYLIKGGTIIDGTGAPRTSGDLGIKDGRIVAIGKLDEEAREVIDATGKIVSPGFVDVHTHYDAQVFWDPDISPSSYHGVTSVFAGNCGFSVAPLVPEAGDYLMRLLAKVEGMPLQSLQTGVPWDWDSFGSYLDKLEGKMAINIGFLVGHSALRRVVMGEDSDKPATPEQLGAMKSLLKKSLSEGGMGFSSSQSPTHNDGDGEPVPSRAATPEELIELSACLRDYPGTLLEFIPSVGPFSEERKQLMTDMSLAAQRSLNWNVLIVTRGTKEIFEEQLTASDYAAERGAEIKALTFAQPVSLRINLWSGFGLDSFPGWAAVLSLPMEERKQAFADPAVREKLVAGANHPDIPVALKATGNFKRMLVEETFTDATAKYQGQVIGDIAQEEGKEPSDVFFDIAVADDLKTTFLPNLGGDDDESWALRGQAWKDPRTLVGASDAGAHLDMIDTFAFSTTLLSLGVRDRGLLTLEEAINEITDRPARFLGLKERGQLREGWYADVVVFDENTVGKGPIHTRYDLPADAGRLYCEAEGIENVLVNGQEIVRNNQLTGAKPGIVMRSGRDTETVPIPACR
ncbi:MAG TPA: aminoacylase [Porticoccaceae bacterium]|nr:aminoacylase [Porticoccaceae bacterium]HCO61143.1 aminoacylase [Porticoccaceae bacterium]